MKKIIGSILLAAIIFLVAGCGPGQPLEIESQNLPQTEVFWYVSADR
jgi:predicted small lipoprotein YifL